MREEGVGVGSGEVGGSRGARRRNPADHTPLSRPPPLSLSDDLELKKLVYLYLTNYAKTQPDLAIMAVRRERDEKPRTLTLALAPKQP